MPQVAPSEQLNALLAERCRDDLRLADFEELEEDPAEIVRGRHDQVAFRHVDESSQPRAAHAARVADMRERTFHLFAPETAEPLPLAGFNRRRFVYTNHCCEARLSVQTRPFGIFGSGM